MSKISKKLKAAYSKIDKEKIYNINDAIKLIKEFATSKFDETVDIVINTGLDPRHADQMLRSSVSLPNGIGKDIRVAVFAKGDKADEAKKAGADIVGSDDLVEEIKAGNINFDRCIATPDMMGKVGQIGRILGPQNLMPNPKLGTVTLDITKAVELAKSGQVEYRVEKNGIVHAGIGKASFTEKSIYENIVAFIQSLLQSKPSGAKGIYLKKTSISTTMGPGVKISINDILTNNS